MRHLIALPLAGLLSLLACASGDDSSGSKFLGSKLTKLADGTPVECTNYYGTQADADAKKLSLDPALCPAANAKGACELDGTEVVYYDDQHAAFREGDACNGSGMWTKQYPAPRNESSNEGSGY